MRRKRPSRGPDRSPMPGAIITRNGKRFVFDLAANAYVAVNPVDETVGRLDDQNRLGPGRLPKEVSEHLYGPDEDLDEDQRC